MKVMAMVVFFSWSKHFVKRISTSTLLQIYFWFCNIKCISMHLKDFKIPLLDCRALYNDFYIDRENVYWKTCECNCPQSPR